MITALAVLSSCTGLYNTARVNSAGFSPEHVYLELEKSDFEYLGETSVSYVSRTYFGIFTMLDSINGEVINRRETSTVNFSKNSDIRIKGKMRQAAVKVVDMFPDADQFIPVHLKTTKEQMFLGSIVRKEVLFRTYKLKESEK